MTSFGSASVPSAYLSLAALDIYQKAAVGLLLRLAEAEKSHTGSAVNGTIDRSRFAAQFVGKATCVIRRLEEE